MRRFVHFAICLCALSAVAGCGGQSGDRTNFQDSAAGTTSPPVSFDSAGSKGADDSAGPAAGLETLPNTVTSGELGQKSETPAESNPQPIERQIIYTARLNLIVEDFTGVPDQVVQLARSHGGYVAQSNLGGSTGSPRSGTWTIRVPVKQYGSFLEDARELGEFQSLTTNSREVTAEYYDVKARIANKQRQEARLLELLDNETAKLEDVLKVEEQLARVREEIERMQGRLRVLNDLTSFSTVTLSINEIKDYQPPAAPTFGNRIARTWSGTLESMLVTGQNLVVGLVAVGPWLVVLSIPILLLIGLIRLLLRRRAPR